MIFSEMIHGHGVWGANCICPRHRHTKAYVAIILCGGYEESGSCGRFRVEQGDVLLHGAFEAHLDRFHAKGAQILNLALRVQPDFCFGRVADADEIARIAERDTIAATALLAERLIEKRNFVSDWPDILAADLLDDPNCRLDTWARKHNLAPETVSRGFGRVFTVSPAAFRADPSRTPCACLSYRICHAPLSGGSGRGLRRSGAYDPRGEVIDRRHAAVLA